MSTYAPEESPPVLEPECYSHVCRGRQGTWRGCINWRRRSTMGVCVVVVIAVGVEEARFLAALRRTFTLMASLHLFTLM